MTSSTNTATNPLAESTLFYDINNSLFTDGTFTTYATTFSITGKVPHRHIEIYSLDDIYEENEEFEKEYQNEYNNLYEQFYKHMKYLYLFKHDPMDLLCFIDNYKYLKKYIRKVEREKDKKIQKLQLENDELRDSKISNEEMRALRQTIRRQAQTIASLQLRLNQSRINTQE